MSEIAVCSTGDQLLAAPADRSARRHKAAKIVRTAREQTFVHGERSRLQVTPVGAPMAPRFNPTPCPQQLAAEVFSLAVTSSCCSTTLWVIVVGARL